MSAVPKPAPLAVTWSEFGSKGADSVWRRAGTWTELIERISTATGYATKAVCPWVKLATFGNVRSKGNSLRHDDNVLGITGVEGDYDDEVMTPDEAVQHLVQCAALFCTYPAVATKADLARVTLARMSLALAVQMNGLGSML